ncbi:hypothetical protein OBBRIDRAFT_828222 [Obba rivulosa]|uniref:Uncharacterized protein n=1 Tax=Obba rivulosa TaxID=1052685 RepID=A0A8E2ARF5_9APHY|nr:hypothetical protein OBBRIDRAFT_828222 [Obba rivulosa]
MDRHHSVLTGNMPYLEFEMIGPFSPDLLKQRLRWNDYFTDALAVDHVPGEGPVPRIGEFGMIGSDGAVMEPVTTATSHGDARQAAASTLVSLGSAQPSTVPVDPGYGQPNPPEVSQPSATVYAAKLMAQCARGDVSASMYPFDRVYDATEAFRPKGVNAEDGTIEHLSR